MGATEISGGWTDLDQRAVDTVRVLAMDAVEQVGNGHPGTAMGLAPAAYLLFQRHLVHDPADPGWIGRDRFVLSNGHSSLTLYIQLYFSGYGLTLDDLKHFRTWGSLTPGHPEHGHTIGVETTTGPLGQGIATAIGMAFAGRRERNLLDADAAPGQSVFDHKVFVFCGDGDLEEGISSEASSLAGHQKLDNLVVVYDDNHISIEGNTDVAFTEDVTARYAAYGWHVIDVALAADGDIDLPALDAALIEARAHTGSPTFIRLRTIIGWPAPDAQNTGEAHGAALGAKEVAATKRILGFDPDKTFDVNEDVLAHAREVKERGAAAHAAWLPRWDAWRAANGEPAALFDRLQANELPDGWAASIPTFETGTSIATRRASGNVINALADVLPELWGGSADLAGSNDTTIKGALSFEAAGSVVPNSGPGGRLLHFGIREHAMGAILNGITLHGRSRVYGGTFLVFSDYMRPSVRLASLMGLPVTYVWTHDSIGLGEDGPTHQPVEHLAALRAIPGLAVVRPADGPETAAAWQVLLERRNGPVGLCLTRQNVPVLEHAADLAAQVGHGGYVLADTPTDTCEVVLMATGSEVQLAMAARQTLADEGIGARVVSLPCFEWFAEQDESYRNSVIPPSVRARVSIEAGIAQPWHALIGDAGRAVSLEHFGASAAAEVLYERFGITAEAAVEAARASIKAAAN